MSEGRREGRRRVIGHGPVPILDADREVRKRDDAHFRFRPRQRRGGFFESITSTRRPLPSIVRHRRKAELPPLVRSGHLDCPANHVGVYFARTREVDRTIQVRCPNTRIHGMLNRLAIVSLTVSLAPKCLTLKMPPGSSACVGTAACAATACPAPLAAMRTPASARRRVEGYRGTHHFDQGVGDRVRSWCCSPSLDCWFCCKN